MSTPGPRLTRRQRDPRFIEAWRTYTNAINGFGSRAPGIGSPDWHALCAIYRGDPDACQGAVEGAVAAMLLAPWHVGPGSAARAALIAAAGSPGYIRAQAAPPTDPPPGSQSKKTGRLPSKPNLQNLTRKR